MGETATHHENEYVELNFHDLTSLYRSASTKKMHSRRILTAAARDRAQIISVGSVVDKVALGQVFLRVLRFFPVRIIPLLLHIHSYIIWWMDKGPVSGRSSNEAQSHLIAITTTVTILIPAD
jgi:hypothetical protein